MNLKKSKFIHISSACQPACSCARCMASEFLHSKGNRIYEAIVLENIYPLHHGVSFHPLSVSFCLQIAYRKVRNLQIGVDKFLIKVLINLLCYIVLA